MPIKVKCACGKVLAVQDQLAGKRVKCPACSQVVSIPAATGPAAGVAAAPTAPTSTGQPAAAQPRPKSTTGGQPAGPANRRPQQAPAAPRPQAGQVPAQRGPRAPGPVAAHPLQPASMHDPLQAGMGALLGEAGIDHVAGGVPCPNCNSGLRPGAVICMKCGFNLQLGERMTTVVRTAEDLENENYDPLLHGISIKEHGNPLLDKAERDIIRDRQMQKTLVQGAPWWMVLLGLVFILGFSVMMIVIGPEIQKKHGMLALLGIAASLFVASSSVMCLISFWLQTVTFAVRNSWLHGLLSFFFPPYALPYAATQYTKAPQLIKMYLFGVLLIPVVIIGCGTLAILFRTVMGTAKGMEWVMLLSWIALLVSNAMMILNWARIASFALEQEPSPVHAILCCLFTNLYSIVYGCMRWQRLKTQTILLLVGTFLSILGTIGFAITFAMMMKMANELAR